MFKKLLWCLFFKIFYLFINERHTEREREAQTQAKGEEAGSMQGARRGTRDSIPGLQDHALGRRQALNRCTTQGSLVFVF